ncbi:MAG: ParB/RepB/Spo0J family partition protein [Candidatus Saccharimonadales bacterium]
MALTEDELYRRQAAAELMPMQEMFDESRYHRPWDVPPDYLNVAHQMRPEEDFGNIRELAQSVAEIGVEQPIRAARWDYDAAAAYLDLNNAAYPEREPLSPGLLLPCPDGASYLVVIYGHRRLLAAREAGQPTVPVKVSENPTFHEVLQLQTAENLHHQPRPVAFARGLNQIYQLGLALGTYDSQAAFARHSALGVQRTRDALRFCQLPGDIQKLVVDNKLSYATAVQVSRLIPVVQSYELLQLRIRRENEADALIKTGQVEAADRKQLIGLQEVDINYLNQRTDAVLGDTLMSIRSGKMSAARAKQHVSAIIRGMKGVGELTLLDEAARRRLELETHRRRAAAATSKAFHDLSTVVAATRLYGSDLPEALIGALNETPVQRLLGQIADAAAEVAVVTRLPATRERSFDAAVAARSLVEIDRIDDDGVLAAAQTESMF